MIVTYYLGCVLLMVIGIALTALPIWLLARKTKLNPKSVYVFQLLGFILLFVIYAKYSALIVDVYNDNDTIEKYMVFGSATFTSSDGQVVEVKPERRDVYIVNGSDRVMVYESVEYGAPLLRLLNQPTFIDPHTLHNTSTEPDYFPTESPPDKASVSRGTTSTSKHWLRYAHSTETR